MKRLAVLALMPLLAFAPLAGAQTPAPAASTVAPAPAPVRLAETPAPELKRSLQSLLRGLPPALGEVLRHDPSLLTRADYLAPYPALAEFVRLHPEVPLNPSFFLGTPWEQPTDAESRGLRMAENLMDGLGVLVVLSTFLAFFAWLVRTAIDHRRWLRQSKAQVEAHTKVLDRLSTHDDLLAYIQSDAGRRFLESAPIEVDGRPRPTNTSLSRVLWAVQGGIVVLALGAGLRMAQGALGTAGQGFAILSTLCLALGVGFLASAAAAYVISIKHGLIGTEQKAQHE